MTDHGWLLPARWAAEGGAADQHGRGLGKGRARGSPRTRQVDHLTLPWRWDPSVRIAVAPGIACYEAGKVYEHGGISPQECVTPHLVVEAAAAPVSAAAASIAASAGRGCGAGSRRRGRTTRSSTSG